MSEGLKKVLAWFYLGPNPHSSSYFRRSIVPGKKMDDSTSNRPKSKTSDKSRAAQRTARR